ncbi:uncharacterized protein L201_006625 [Kwoniella dendrophila CBS 6074]|uniref:t-SNARE coiled-coil homology domain-containing protein n=1 Tax=Kwoniella dendrophila CBS 6074 TaxID=1295534 RepID=A0AAX4K2T2_9TREE
MSSSSSSSPTSTTISMKLNSTSSLLLERSRIISLNLKPSPTSLSQITRNLITIKSDLDQLELKNKGLSLGGGGGGGGGFGGGSSKVKGNTSNNKKEFEELEERYNKLLEILSEDELGKEKVKQLIRKKEDEQEEEVDDYQRSSSPSIYQPTPSPKPKLNSIQTPSINEVPKLNIEPPTPGINHNNNNLRPFKDYPESLDDEERDTGLDHNDMLDHQQMLMNDQDERLNLLSNSIGRQNDLSIQIGSELDIHHQLLEDTDHAMDRTSANLHRARRRLDKVADEAKQHGSTITIVVLIFILLILIIVFKT